MTQDQETTPAAARFSPRLVLGLSVMAAGLLLTLDNLGLVAAREYWPFWPVILIAVGLAKMAQSLQERGRPAGAGLVLLGAALLLLNLGLLRTRYFWPILLLVVGARIAWQALTTPGRKRSSNDTTTSSFSAFALMGGVRRGTSAQDFRRGDAVAVMGGCEIDLRGASIADGEAAFDSFAMMGGVEIRVPEDWAVDNRGVALLGGFTDKTRRPTEPTKRLVLTGLAILGGVEVKN